MKKTIIPFLTLLITAFILTAPAHKTRAGWIGGEEHLAGFSKYLDEYYERIEKQQEEDKAKAYLQEQQRQIEILYRIVEAEATDGTLEQKMNVASCILARVGSKDWPDTIEGVVFQKKQFSPISDGRYYTVTITESTIEAVTIVRQQGLLHNCVWFCTPTCKSARSGFHSRLDFQFYDGMHNYYY